MDGFLDKGAETFLERLFSSLSRRFPLQSHVRLFLFRVTSVPPDLFTFYFYSEILKDEHLVEVRLLALL